MEQIKRIVKRIFFLPPALTLVIAVPSFVFVVIILSSGTEQSVLSYIAYVLSAYGLIISVTGISKVARAARNGFEMLPVVEKVTKHPLGRRYFSDAAFRTKVSLYFGVAMNLAYVALKLGSGVYYRSAWFLSLAGYYALLVAMRFFLLRRFDDNAVGQDLKREYRRYRGCGVLLLFMNQALAVIVIMMVHQNRGYEYPGLLIYAMAAYAFYAVILAVVNMVKYRRHGSPILSAAKAINMTAALVSILSLETAMLAQFGGDSDPLFRQIMTGALGACVCTAVFFMAIFMIARSTRQLKRLRSETAQTGQKNEL